MLTFSTGNKAVATAVKDAKTVVVAAYPITPQTEVVEETANNVASGELKARYIPVESEHSSMGACIGSAATGVRTFVVTGIIESALAMRLDEFERNLPHGIHLAYLPEGGIIRLRLTGSSTDSEQINADMARLSRQLHDILGGHIIADGDKRLPEILGERLCEKGLTLSTAESCTGGNIAHEITSIAGSSDYFKGAVVSYANEVKTSLLGVNEQDIITHGVVSEPVVRQMAEGACRALGTDCAIATSGIAGPGGGTPNKPVGTVWMAAKCGDKVVTQVKRLPGDRSRVISRATLEAQLLLLSLVNSL